MHIFLFLFAWQSYYVYNIFITSKTDHEFFFIIWQEGANEIKISSLGEMCRASRHYTFRKQHVEGGIETVFHVIFCIFKWQFFCLKSGESMSTKSTLTDQWSSADVTSLQVDILLSCKLCSGNKQTTYRWLTLNMKKFKREKALVFQLSTWAHVKTLLCNTELLD